MTNFARLEFDRAIKNGRLSVDKTAPNYAGNYMYMGESETGEKRFKHIVNRNYLSKSGKKLINWATGEITDNK